MSASSGVAIQNIFLQQLDPDKLFVIQLSQVVELTPFEHFAIQVDADGDNAGGHAGSIRRRCWPYRRNLPAIIQRAGHAIRPRFPRRNRFPPRCPGRTPGRGGDGRPGRPCGFFSDAPWQFRNRSCLGSGACNGSPRSVRSSSRKSSVRPSPRNVTCFSPSTKHRGSGRLAGTGQADADIGMPAFTRTVDDAPHDRQ